MTVAAHRASQSLQTASGPVPRLEAAIAELMFSDEVLSVLQRSTREISAVRDGVGPLTEGASHGRRFSLARLGCRRWARLGL